MNRPNKGRAADLRAVLRVYPDDPTHPRGFQALSAQAQTDLERIRRRAALCFTAKESSATRRATCLRTYETSDLLITLLRSAIIAVEGTPPPVAEQLEDALAADAAETTPGSTAVRAYLDNAEDWPLSVARRGATSVEWAHQAEEWLHQGLAYNVQIRESNLDPYVPGICVKPFYDLDAIWIGGRLATPTEDGCWWVPVESIATLFRSNGWKVAPYCWGKENGAWMHGQIFTPGDRAEETAQ